RLARYELVERYRLHPGPDSTRGAKIRNPALGRYPCAGKRDDNLGVIDQTAQPRDSVGDIGYDHNGSAECWQAADEMRFPCAISIPCSVSAISTARSNFTAGASAFGKSAAGWTTRTATRLYFSRRRSTKIECRKGNAASAMLRSSSSPT